jgi:hypothetical protein
MRATLEEEGNTMADQQHLAVLEQGVTAWNEWRRQHPELSPDLSGADLSGGSLSRTGLRETDFSETNRSLVVITRKT